MAISRYIAQIYFGRKTADKQDHDDSNDGASTHIAMGPAERLARHQPQDGVELKLQPIALGYQAERTRGRYRAAVAASKQTKRTSETTAAIASKARASLTVATAISAARFGGKP